MNIREESRSELTRLFHWSNQDRLDRLSDGDMDEVRRNLLRCDDLQFIELPDTITDIGYYVERKEHLSRETVHRYARIFDFAGFLGVKHICDLGCWSINQSFLFRDDDDMTYTGMDQSRFALIDWREKDRQTDNYRIPCTTEAPPPLFDGRVRFVKGQYPDTPFEIVPDSLLVASYSLTMLPPHSIHEAVFCLTRNFDRMLFNVAWERADIVLWKTSDWSGYAIHPVGPNGFVFATRHPEDIELMKKLYPCDDRGWFDTAIDMDSMPGTSPEERKANYVDWRRDMDE